MVNQKSLLEVALEIMESTSEAVNIYKLIEDTLAKCEITDDDGTLKAKLYTDIITSSKFVFMGEDMWDLKKRQSLDQFDKDGATFNTNDYEEEVEDEDDNDEDNDDLDLDDEEESEDEDDLDDNDSEESDDVEFEEYDEESEDDDKSYDDTDLDEEKYNKYMDDYEDLYDEN